MISVFYSPNYVTSSDDRQPALTIADQTPDDTRIVCARAGQPYEAWLSCTLGELRQWIETRNEVIASQFGTPAPEPTGVVPVEDTALPAHDTEVSL